MPKITILELRELIEENEIKPAKLFDKEDFLADKALMKALREKAELEAYRAEKKKKKEKEGDASHIPGDDLAGGGSESGSSDEGDADHIPD